MSDEREWDLMVEALIAQGVVATEAEAVERLARGETLPLRATVDAKEWRGLYGTSS